MDRQGSPLFLPRRIVSQWARYLRDVQDLTLEGNVEPRRWIGCAERFWLGVADATGDWLQRGEAAPPDGRVFAPPRQPTILPAGVRTLEIAIEVPPAAFAILDSPLLHLRPAPLCRGDEAVLLPNRHLRFPQPIVSSSDRSAELRLFDLPELQPGIQLRGVVFAERSPADANAAEGGELAVVAGIWICVS